MKKHAITPKDNTPEAPKAPSIYTTFDTFGLSAEMNRAITEMGFTVPSPIQQETIPLLHKKQTDFLGLAATGTGKTAAYGIPLLENMLAGDKVKGVQALILCPTRELAKQVTEQMNLLARYKKTKAIAIYGGSDYAGQLRALKEGVSIVVGTPGRIIDHLERGTLNLNHLQTVILDEADEMISMGFKTEIEFILEKVSQEEKHQTWLFSATMSRDIRKIADQFLDNPQQIQINKTEKVSSAVKQFYYQVREDDKPAVIEKIMDLNPDFYGLIFCQTKMLVADLTNSLKSNGYRVDCLHGDMEQNARERVLKAFKNKDLTVLVCTDVASRGIDVKDLTHVINYSLPRELDLYVHRIGRTGRGGKEGIALSLVTQSHMGLVYRIESTTQSKMTKIPVPGDSELLSLKMKKSLESFLALGETDAIGVATMKETLLTTEWATALADLDKEEIVARFLATTLKSKSKPKAKAFEEEGRDSKRRGFMDRQGGGDRGRDRGGYSRDRGFSDRPRREYGSVGGAPKPSASGAAIAGPTPNADGVLGSLRPPPPPSRFSKDFESSDSSFTPSPRDREARAPRPSREGGIPSGAGRPFRDGAAPRPSREFGARPSRDFGPSTRPPRDGAKKPAGSFNYPPRAKPARPGYPSNESFGGKKFAKKTEEFATGPKKKARTYDAKPHRKGPAPTVAK